jgi:acyl-CoA synthetase (AMP-forming)/AMP-acid ligase II
MTEKGIYSHPDLSEIIAECAAIRTKPGTLGESLLVVIRFKPGVENPPDAPALRRMLKDHLTKQEMPREFRITREPLPKGDTGKPDWKKMEEDEAKVEAPSPQNPTL